MGCCCCKPLTYPPDLPPGHQIQVYESVVAGPCFIIQNDQCIYPKIREIRNNNNGSGTFMITKEGLFYYRNKKRIVCITYDLITGITVSDHFSFRKSGFIYRRPCGCRGCNNACGINSFINIECMYNNAATTISVGVIDGEELAQQVNKLLASATF